MCRRENIRPGDRELLGAYERRYGRGRKKPGIGFTVAALGACGRLGDLKRGAAIHAQVAIAAPADAVVANKLVDMYAKCGSMVDAKRVFDAMARRDLVSWTSMVQGYARAGQWEAALELYAKMDNEGCAASSVTHLAALKACSALAAKEAARLVQGRYVKLESLKRSREIEAEACVSDVHVASSLVDVYARCGSMGDACRVFQAMPVRTPVTWNSIVMGYAHNGQGEAALSAFRAMEPATPNSGTYVAALKACAVVAQGERGLLVAGKVVKVLSLARVKAIHDRIVLVGGRDRSVLVENTLVDVYACCGSLADARLVFESMADRSVVSWNCIIKGYAENGEGEAALELYRRMGEQGYAPSRATTLAALKACAWTRLEDVMFVHLQATSAGHDQDPLVISALLDVYCKLGSLSAARAVFDSHARPAVGAWNCMISGYARAEDPDTALELYDRLLQQELEPNQMTFNAALKASIALADGGKKGRGLDKGRAIHREAASRGGYDSNVHVATSLVDMYGKCGSMVEASQVFQDMDERTVVSWNCIMCGYLQSGEPELVLQLYSRMDCERDTGSYSVALKACADLAHLEAGKRVHRETAAAGMEGQVQVANSLVDFYAKCGNMADAEAAFEAAEKRDVVTWGALIAGYSRQGDTECVLELLEQMQQQQQQPDALIFLSVLTACSHAGLVEQGKKCFCEMSSVYGVRPWREHYNALVDMLGRANRLEEAVLVVQDMPFQPNAVLWMSLLAACRKWRNVNIGRMAFSSLLQLDERNSAAYDLMSRLYAAEGMWEEARTVKQMKRRAGAWERAGKSWWGDEDGLVHSFGAGTPH